MSTKWIRMIVGVVSAGIVGAAGVGCELMVQLDRSAVEIADAACTICSDVTEEDDDASPDGESTDTGTGATDAGTEASMADAAGGE